MFPPLTINLFPFQVDPNIPGSPGGNSGGAGRVCLPEYIKLGYIPTNCTAGSAPVSRSMNYWHSDLAISNAAFVLGEKEDAGMLRARSRNWKNLYDGKTGHFRPKLFNGSFQSGFDEFAWGPGPGYTEAGPWQYRFEVPYDPPALQDAFKASGFDGCDLIQRANTINGAFHFGGYGSEIHEMSEMAINCWGQWELNNQPVWALQHMQVGFSSSVTGKCAGQAQKWLRQSNSLLKATSEMYPGDEDNGSMGAWFIFNMLGLYPLSPGRYVITYSVYIQSMFSVKVSR